MEERQVGRNSTQAAARGQSQGDVIATLAQAPPVGPTPVQAELDQPQVGAEEGGYFFGAYPCDT